MTNPDLLLEQIRANLTEWHATLARTLDPVAGVDALIDASLEQPLTFASSLADVRAAIRAYRRGETLSPVQLARLASQVSDIRVRDDAWARMIPKHAKQHLRLWTDVARHTAGKCTDRRDARSRLAAPVCSLLAFVAWQADNRALAVIACERALDAIPGYTMALLIQSALAAMLPSSAARPPMTPKAVAASW